MTILAERLGEVARTHVPARSRYRGKLIAVEGLDGSGKSTQIYLLKRWLELQNLKVTYTEWNSSVIVKAATKKGNTMTSLSADERARWRDTLKPTTEKLLTDLEGQGVKDARAIFAEMQQRIAKYEGAKK